MVPSRRKSRPSGTSSAVSSRPSIVRAIAPVRALTTREAVGRDMLGKRWESGRRVVVDPAPRFAPPSRGSSRVEAAEAILARVSDGPRRAAGRGIVEGGCEQDRRDDDAPEAGLTGTLFQRRLATARRPPRRGSPTDGAPDPGPRPDSPGAGAQTDGATGTTGTTDTTSTTGPGLVPAARPRRPPLVGDGADKPSFGAFPRISARFYRGCHQLMDRTGRRFP